MTVRSKLRLLIPTVAIAAMVASCNVTESSRVALTPQMMQYSDVRPCSSEVGSYSLSKTTFKLEIHRYGSGPYVLADLSPERTPDSGHTYCLDYLAYHGADDALTVGYGDKVVETKGSGLLKFVASFAVDRSADIARNLIRAIFVGLSRDPNFSANRTGLGSAVDEATKVTLGRFEVDPLDAADMAKLNNRIKDFGFCLILDDYTYNTSQAAAQSYCANPLATLRRFPSPKLARLREQRWLKPEPDRGGILYRPRLPYTLHVYTKSDPRGPGPWQLRKTQNVDLENLAPIVSLGLKRRLFASNRVGMEFDGGVLQNICIAKTSEAAGFIEIPLDIVYGIVSLPSATIRAEISRATQTAKLVKAEEQLIAAQASFIEFEKNKSALQHDIASANPSVVGGCKTTTEGCPSTQKFPTAVDPTKDSDKFLSNVCGSINDALLQ